MIQYQCELSEEIKKLNSLVGYHYLQKIYSSSTLVSISLRSKGKTWFIYLGRGHGVEGFWISDIRIPRELRGKDRFLEYLRRHLSSSELLSIVQVFNDRCVHITYQKYGQKNSFIFFWKGRKLYFLHYFFDIKSEKKYLLKSWMGGRECERDVSIDDLYNSLIEVGLSKEFTGDQKKSKTSICNIIENERKKLISSNISPRKLKFLNRKIDHIEKDLEKIENAIELQNELNFNQFNFSNLGEKLIFKNISIKLPRGFNAFKKRDKVFEKIKSYKKAKIILEQRKEQTQLEVKNFNKKEVRDFRKTLSITSPFWIMPKKNTKDRLALKENNISGVKIFKMKDGIVFGVGTSAISNDFLRSKWGASNNLWFHLDGYKGSHIVVKESNIGNISEEGLKIIASALRDYSRQKIEEVPVVFTQLKNIKGMKGAKGKIIYKGEKYMKIEYDSNWREKVNSE